MRFGILRPSSCWMGSCQCNGTAPSLAVMVRSLHQYSMEPLSSLSLPCSYLITRLHEQLLSTPFSSPSNRLPSQPPRLLRIHLILLLIPTPLLDRLKRRPPTIELPPASPCALNLPPPTPFQLLRHADRLVAPEALPHIHHAALTLAEPAFQLLALRG